LIVSDQVSDHFWSCLIMFDQLSAEILASLIKGFPTTRTTTTTTTRTTTTTKQNVDPAVYYVYSRVKTLVEILPYYIDTLRQSHHAEGVFDPNPMNSQMVTIFGYPRACRFRKHQFENRSWLLPLPIFFKTWFLLHKMWLKLAKNDQKWNASSIPGPYYNTSPFSIQTLSMILFNTVFVTSGVILRPSSKFY
jgi:hypothetical protein